MSIRTIQIFSLILAVFLVLYSCNGTVTTPETGNVVIEGRVEGSAPSGDDSGIGPPAVEGAEVTLARVTSDGSLERYGDAVDETDAGGVFLLIVHSGTLDENARKLVVVAEKDERQWKVVIPGELEVDRNIRVKPLNDESTAEASVFQEVEAGDNGERVSKADIEFYIGSRTAAGMNEEEEGARRFAEALTAEAAARVALFAELAVDIPEEQIEDVRFFENEALRKLYADLDNAFGDETDISEAYTLFLDAVADAPARAGLEAAVYARVREAAGHLIREHMVDFDADIRSEVHGNIARSVAAFIDRALILRFDTFNADESSVQMVVNAGNRLRDQLREDSGLTDSDLETIFDTYNAEIMDPLMREFPGAAQTVAAINNEINRTRSIKDELETALEEGSGRTTVVEAYSAFYVNVRAVIDNIFVSASEQETRFLTDVLILINVAN